jgi:outer membrane protein OmpA-like peptidoglycan-associated protein
VKKLVQETTKSTRNYSQGLRYTLMRLTVFILFLFNFLSAQNLVVNPGFEESTTETTGVLSVSGVEGWSMPSDGTSDYYVVTNKQRKEYGDAPPGSRSIIPLEGDACAGYFSLPGVHEYICGSFSEPLVEDSVYTISFAIATLGNMEFSDGRIGIYFTNDESPHYNEGGMVRIRWKPQVTIDSSMLTEEIGYWKIYSTTYRAKGGEQSFVIGDYSETFDKNPRLTTEATYFYIDSIFIGLTEHAEESEAIEKDTAVEIDQINVAAVEPQLPPSDTLIAAGKTLTLENIYFETNKSRILPESYQPLYDIIIELKLQPDLKVEIVGHTDKHGDAKANQKLSEDRAKAVADFFISKGIDPSRITTKGYGSSQPVGNDDQKNRRVEFIFTE